jgi:hypothetical protein
MSRARPPVQPALALEEEQERARREEDAAMETVYRLSGTTEVSFASEPCEECRDEEAHTLDRALIHTPYPFYDVDVLPRSDDADGPALHLAFLGNEVLYAMHLDDEEARELLATLRKAVDLLTERLGPSTSELPAFPGAAHRPRKKRRRNQPEPPQQ